MKYFLVSLLITASVISARGQDDNPLAVYDNLVDKVWKTEGKWGDGTPFRMEVEMKYALDKKLVIAETKGFTDKEMKIFGHRNHGIRQFDPKSKELRFWEFDIFGGVTEGKITVEGKNIFYTYPYQGIEITDGWIYVDDSHYQLKIGQYIDGEWKQTFLSATFSAE